MKNILIIILLISVITIGCKKHYSPVRPISYSLYLKFEKNGEIPPDSVLSHISMSYNTGSFFTNIPDFIPAINDFADLGILTTLKIGELSAVKYIKNYILSYPDGQVDTLFIDFQKVSEEDAYKEPCFCMVPLKEILVNGIVPEVATYTPEGTPVYIVEIK